MVQAQCLEEDEPDDPNHHDHTLPLDELSGCKVKDQSVLNIHHGFTTALRCYPFVIQLASQLDLTTLHELSRVCRQFRSSLLQHRKQLIARTLRCENENDGPALRLGKAINDSFQAWMTHSQDEHKNQRLTSGKVSACARDLISECRRCGKVVCRNCTMKSPSRTVLRSRHRRLCRTCMKSRLLKMEAGEAEDEDCFEIDDHITFATQSSCACSESVWICSPCGQSLRIADTTYTRGWSWRTRYSTCGGFGAGLGEGVEGVECGRGATCLDTVIMEKEVECDADELAIIEEEMAKARLSGHSWAGTSYTTQEMVGIGGQVKMKAKKMVVVGASVKEYEDERCDGHYLAREQQGLNRSWCSWCDRVILSTTDMSSQRC